jgi:hypothetical protein
LRRFVVLRLSVTLVEVVRLGRPDGSVAVTVSLSLALRLPRRPALPRRLILTLSLVLVEVVSDVLSEPIVIVRAAERRALRFFFLGGAGPWSLAVSWHGEAQVAVKARPRRRTPLSVCLRLMLTPRIGDGAVGATALLLRESLPPALEAVTSQAICCPRSASTSV